MEMQSFDQIDQPRTRKEKEFKSKWTYCKKCMTRTEFVIDEYDKEIYICSICGDPFIHYNKKTQ